MKWFGLMWHDFRASRCWFWRENILARDPFIFLGWNVNSGHHLKKTDPLYRFGNPNFLSRQFPTLSILCSSSSSFSLFNEMI
ncbi:hypothetical protein Hanom_Chr12g01089331 [Helianthus anomalus]